MPHQKPCFFSAAEEVLHSLDFQTVISGRHADIANRIAFPTGIGILIPGILKTRNLSKRIQWKKRCHELGMARVQEDDIPFEFRKCILLTTLEGEFSFQNLGLRKRNDHHTRLVQFSEDLGRQRLFQEFAGTAHGAERIPPPAYHFFHTGLAGQAHPSAEGVTSQDTHHTAVAVFIAVCRGPCRSGRVYEHIAFHAERFVSLFAGHCRDSALFHIHVRHPGLTQDLYPFAKEELFDQGLHFSHIVKRSVMVARKLHIAMKTVLIGQAKKFTAAHGLQLLGGCEPAVVSHDPADQAGPQQHVCPLEQHHFSPLLTGR